MQRFAADGTRRVLYYEERMERSAVLTAIGMLEDGIPIDFVIDLELFSLKRVQLLTPFDLSSYISYKGRFNKLVSEVGWCFYLAWMSFRLSHRIFLFFIQSRSPLRSFMENKNIRHDSQKTIAS